MTTIASVPDSARLTAFGPPMVRRPAKISSPRPGPCTRMPSAAMPTSSTADTRTPASTTGQASGSSMRSSRRTGPMPTPLADSTTAGSTDSRPVTVLRTIGSREYRTRPGRTTAVPSCPTTPNSSENSAKDGTVRMSPVVPSTTARAAGRRATSTPSVTPMRRADRDRLEDDDEVLERQAQDPLLRALEELDEGHVAGNHVRAAERVTIRPQGPVTVCRTELRRAARTPSSSCRPSGPSGGPRRVRRGGCRARSRWTGSRRTASGLTSTPCSAT